MDRITQDIAIPKFDVTLSIRREDLLHPFISGNKFRKLKYNLLEAQAHGHDTLLTFGGAFSNHIAAVAAAGNVHQLKTIGIIRGEELENVSNPTLDFAREQGMHLVFISREAYRMKDTPEFIETLRTKFGRFYLLPEGGTNALAVKGCEEILSEDDFHFDYICCAVGTGGTLAGIANSAFAHQKVLGFPVLNADLRNDIKKYTRNDNWELVTDYHFGGYAKTSNELIQFINDFYSENHIALDPIYTGKLIFGVMDRIKRGYFKSGTKIMAVHTGGLQGISGMNTKLKNKNLPLIET